MGNKSPSKRISIAKPSLAQPKEQMEVIKTTPEPLIIPRNGKDPKVVIRPMLTTAQKNFRTVKDCPTIESCYLPPDITREELNVPGSRCFLLHSVLTPEECAHYIHETEQVGYEDLTRLFPVDYRSNDRVLSICKPLVECLWRRIEPHLTRREVICIRPVGFGNEGTWRPSRLNECCKFGKYKCGGHFSPHLDGPWVPNEEESSIFTVVIYLSNDLEGGATSFLSEGGEVICSVSPKAGTAVIFNHDTLHEGQPVTQGTKYIIRTEIMFRRVDTEMLPNPTSYQENENYLKTVALYTKSWELEQAGDTQGFTDTYLEGLALQCQEQRTVSKDTVEIHRQALPYDVYMRIFCYLSVKDLGYAMAVSKMWYTMCMDGQLWYNLYRKKWSDGRKLQLDPVPFTKDWYRKYKQRVVAGVGVCQKVACIDLGSFSSKFAVIDRHDSFTSVSSIESVVAVVDGLYDFHLRRQRHERYFCGKDAKAKYPNHIVNIVQEGIPVRPELLSEIMFGFFIESKVFPSYCPVIVLEPPGLWDNAIRAKVAAEFVWTLLCPSLVYLSSAVAVLAGLDVASGIVLDVGREKVTCAAVYGGSLCPNPLSCDPASASPNHLASMVDRTVLGCGENAAIQNVLKKCVVVSTEEKSTSIGVRKELMAKDKSYHVIEPDDVKFAAVKGGCSVAMQTHFSNMKTFPKNRVNDKGSSPFYVELLFYHYLHWGSQFHNRW